MRRTPDGKASAVKKVASCAGDIIIKARNVGLVFTCSVELYRVQEMIKNTNSEAKYQGNAK